MPDLMMRFAASPAMFEPEARLKALNLQATIENGIGLDTCWRVVRRHARRIIGFVSIAVTPVGTAVFLIH